MLRVLKIVLFGILFTLTATQTYAHSQTQIIEMTSNGFESDSVAVDEGSTIIFVNKDKNPRWPASNIHPTHGIYPEFDPKMPIEPGKDWTFKPKKPGSFKYHDHLKPHFRGTLIVESEDGDSTEKSKTENSSPFTNLVNSIKNTFSNLLVKITSVFNTTAEKDITAPNLDKLSTEEQFKALENYAKDAGAEKSWELVKITFKGQAGSSGNIHDLAHLSGNLIFSQKGFSGISSCSAEFAFGCYHGFLDTAFSQNLDKLVDAQEACLKIGQEGSGPVSSCIHGIGHGIASFYSSNNLKSSLGECRKLTSGREYCYDGVFMEFVRSAPETFFKKDNPLYPCDELEKSNGPLYSFSCGRNQPALLMSRFKMGFDDVIKVCQSSNSSPFKQACFDSLGFALASSGDVNQIIQGCQKIGITEFILSCAKAAAGELIFQEVPGWEEKSETVCNAFLEGKEACLAHLDRLIKEYGRVKKITFTPIEPGEDQSSYIRHEMKKCYDTNGRGGCYKDVANLLYSQLGLKKTLGLLKANENYSEIHARCHEVTHYLSRLEYEKQKNIAKVYSQCDSTCHGGCYHGTMEAYLQDKLTQDINLSGIFPKVCGGSKDYDMPIEFNECLHGMGHAAMFVTEMELIKSLSLCDSFSEQEHQERCYSGVFMENSSSSTSNDHNSKYLKADDPYFPCNSLDEKYQPLCWQYQSSYFAILMGQDFIKVSKMCLNVPEKYQNKCIRTIGTNQVGFTSDFAVMWDNCSKMPTAEYQDICAKGVISSLAYRFVGDIDRMVKFCSLVNSNSQEGCYRQIGTSLLDWSNDKSLAKQNCSKIPNPQASSWCLNSI